MESLSPQALRYLEDLQSRINTARGLSPEKRNEAAEAGHLANAHAAFEAVAPDHPGPPEEWAAQLHEDQKGWARSRGMSRYEYLPTFIVLLERATEIEDAAQHFSMDLHPRPVLGTLPLSTVNAKVVAVPGTDEHLVLFDEDFFIFALLISKAVSYAMPLEVEGSRITASKDEDAIERRIAGNDDVRRRFQEAVETYVMQGSPAAAPQYYLDQHYSHVAKYIWESMERFAVGHEYGHFLAGHLRSGSTQAALLGSEEVYEFLPKWEEEFEADRLSLSLTLYAMAVQGGDPGVGYMGVDLFFSSLDIAERAISMVKTGDENHRPRRASHPPVEMRRERLRKTVPATLKEEFTSYAELAVTTGQQVEWIVERLWRDLRPVFRRYYLEDRRPLRPWTP